MSVVGAACGGEGSEDERCVDMGGDGGEAALRKCAKVDGESRHELRAENDAGSTDGGRGGRGLERRREAGGGGDGERGAGNDHRASGAAQRDFGASEGELEHGKEAAARSNDEHALACGARARRHASDADGGGGDANACPHTAAKAEADGGASGGSKLGCEECAVEAGVRLLLAERAAADALASQLARTLEAGAAIESRLDQMSRERELSAEAEAEASAALSEQVGLIDKANIKASGVTLLERKRLELARALAAKPQLLLLDEIAGGLTEQECHSLVATVRQLHKTGLSIIWIEHVVHALMAVVDRIVVLDFGQKIADGAPSDVMVDPEVRRIYMGIDADG